MEVNLIHTTDLSGRSLWIAFDKTRTVRKRNRKAALKEWTARYGVITTVIRFEGVARPSEAAMHIAEVQMANG